MHTLNRLQKFGILKLDDEINIQEQKFVFKWENKNLPKGTQELIAEKNDRLRGRRFNISCLWSVNSISYKLAKKLMTLCKR